MRLTARVFPRARSPAAESAKKSNKGSRGGGRVRFALAGGKKEGKGGDDKTATATTAPVEEARDDVPEETGRERGDAVPFPESAVAPPAEPEASKGPFLRKKKKQQSSAASKAPPMESADDATARSAASSARKARKKKKKRRYVPLRDRPAGEEEEADDATVKTWASVIDDATLGTRASAIESKGPSSVEASIAAVGISGCGGLGCGGWGELGAGEVDEEDGKRIDKEEEEIKEGGSGAEAEGASMWSAVGAWLSEDHLCRALSNNQEVAKTMMREGVAETAEVPTASSRSPGDDNSSNKKEQTNEGGGKKADVLSMWSAVEAWLSEDLCRASSNHNEVAKMTMREGVAATAEVPATRSRSPDDDNGSSKEEQIIEKQTNGGGSEKADGPSMWSAVEAWLSENHLCRASPNNEEVSRMAGRIGDDDDSVPTACSRSPGDENDSSKVEKAGDKAEKFDAAELQQTEDLAGIEGKTNTDEKAEELLESKTPELETQAAADKVEQKADEKVQAMAAKRQAMEAKTKAESEENVALRAQIAQLTQAISFDRKASKRTIDAHNDELKQMRDVIEGLKKDLERTKRWQNGPREGPRSGEIEFAGIGAQGEMEILAQKAAAMEEECAEGLEVVRSLTDTDGSAMDPQKSLVTTSLESASFLSYDSHDTASNGEGKLFGLFRSFMPTEAISFDTKASKMTANDELEQLRAVVEGLKKDLEQTKQLQNGRQEGPQSTPTGELAKAISFDRQASQRAIDAQNEELKKMKETIEGLKGDIEKERQLKEAALQGKHGHETAPVEAAATEVEEYAEGLEVVRSSTAADGSTVDPRQCIAMTSLDSASLLSQDSHDTAPLRFFGWFRRSRMNTLSTMGSDTVMVSDTESSASEDDDDDDDNDEGEEEEEEESTARSLFSGESTSQGPTRSRLGTLSTLGSDAVLALGTKSSASEDDDGSGGDDENTARSLTSKEHTFQGSARSRLSTLSTLGSDVIFALGKDSITLGDEEVEEQDADGGFEDSFGHNIFL